MKKFLALAVALATSVVCLAQTEQSQVIENGGTGPYKSVAIGDKSLPTHMIYRPENLKAYVAENGKIPVLLYANGACANNSLEMSRLLSEVASWGYIVLAIGPYMDMPDEAFYNQWKGVVRGWYPETKPIAIMGNGERLTPYTEAELAAQAAEREAAQKAAAAAARKNKNKKPVVTVEPPFRTYARQLLEALDWLTDQNGNEESEYYHLIDLEKVAAMGQSCGGAQVLGVAHDPRIKTCMIFNSGIGEMSMSGASKKSLANLHTPMLYINGGTADVAYNNANGDWGRIADCIPVVKISTLDGHHGTYYEAHAGAFAVVARMWMNWQLKGQVGDSALFMNDEYEKAFYPQWTFERKNW
jgi:Dipeptidyl aminopeptidases/acylaminoacyl-peptidases